MDANLMTNSKLSNFCMGKKMWGFFLPVDVKTARLLMVGPF